MPELPEVETMVRGIRPFVEGRELVALRKCRCRCRPVELRPGFARAVRRAVGQTVTAVRRRAKRVILELESGEAFVIEPRMTGLMLLRDPPDVEHLRFEWAFAGDRGYNSVWFWDRRGLGTVRLCSPHELAGLLGTENLGPDALEMTLADWRERCRKTSRPIKVALLDQKLAAGIGNLYASEILHVARIHPGKPSDRLTRAQLERLHAATQSVLETAIRYEGSTLGDGTYRNALNESGGYQNAHRVYARQDETCPTCNTGRVRRIVQAQRSTFYCPRCQR
jgi:formamidopyrimidine-DNA glycosylase